MYKAIKDNKIIAISDTDSDFICLVKDEVVEDTEHTVADYTMYGSEYLLNEDVPAPTHDEQSAKRAEAYQQEVDPITSHIQRLRDIDPVPQDEIDELIAERDAKVEEIRQRYPYNGE